MCPTELADKLTEGITVDQAKVLLRYLAGEIQGAIEAITQDDSFENWQSSGYAILWDECEKLRFK